MTPDQNHYQVLSVSEDASESEIEKAFYRKVREHSPEQDPEDHERIQEAYEVLSNEGSRKEYDYHLAHDGKIEQLKDQAERLLSLEDPAYEKAIKKLKQAIVLGPEIGLLRNQLGEVYLQNRQPKNALQQFEKAVELDETNTGYQLSRGHALKQLSRLKEAERTFRGVWERDEGYYAAARALAGVLFQREKAEEAHEVLDTAIWADDKLNFEDFFCYYDKLQLYVAQGKTEILEDELETVKDLPETDEDRKYAAFMLAQTGQTLAEVNVYRLAREFVDAAVELDPENPRLRATQDFVEENAHIEQSFEEIAASSSIHEFVKHIVAVFYQRYLGVIDEKEFQERADEIDAGLRNVMKVDPENTEIKESVRRVRDQYPEVFQIYEYGFEAVLSMPEATHRVDDCPHCGEAVRFEKSQTSKGNCPSCKNPVVISGNAVKAAYENANWDISPKSQESRNRLKERVEEGQLHQSASEGDVKRVRELLDAGTDLHKQDDDGQSPLHLAAEAGSARVVKVLLKEGADPEQRDKYDQTPLFKASSPEVALMLLRAGADPNGVSQGGSTPLHKAAINGHPDVAKVIIESGADLNRRGGSRERAPLHWAAYWGHPDVAEVLLQKGADPDRTAGFGRTALLWAQMEGNTEVLETLLREGANPNLANDSGQSPLSGAATEGNLDVLEMLIDSGADVNRTTNNGLTSLHSAALRGRVDAVRILIRAGADLNIRDKWNRTPLDLAEEEDEQEVFQLLRRHGGEKGSGKLCFVATAVYGGTDHPDVLKLRKFRDEVLTRLAVGRAFIEVYYRYGPTAAKLIDERPILKRLVRYLLKYLVDRFL